MECIRLVHTEPNQRDLTLGQSMREQPLLHVMHCLDIKHSYEVSSRYSKRLSNYGTHKTILERTTIIILNIGTDRSEQTVQTQIRLLLMEQSDPGLLCLLFCLHLLNTKLHCKIQLFQL